MYTLVSFAIESLDPKRLPRLQYGHSCSNSHLKHVWCCVQLIEGQSWQYSSQLEIRVCVCLRFNIIGAENGILTLHEMRMMSWPWLWVVLLVLLQFKNIVDALCIPQSGCDVAYAYYKAQANETLDSIAAKFQTTADEILAVNPTISNSIVVTDQPLYIPFNCECLHDELYHTFNYQVCTAVYFLCCSFVINTIFRNFGGFFLVMFMVL